MNLVPVQKTVAAVPIESVRGAAQPVLTAPAPALLPAPFVEPWGVHPHSLQPPPVVGSPVEASPSQVVASPAMVVAGALPPPGWTPGPAGIEVSEEFGRRERLAARESLPLKMIRGVLYAAERIDAVSYGKRLTIIYSLSCVYCICVIVSAIWSIPLVERSALLVFFAVLAVYGLARLDAFRADDGRWTWKAAARGIRGGWERASEGLRDWHGSPAEAKRASLTTLLVMGGCVAIAVRGGFEWVLAPRDSMIFLSWGFIGWAAIVVGLYRWYKYRSAGGPAAKALPPANVLRARASGLPAVIDLVRDRDASLQRVKAGADDYLYSLLAVLAEWKPGRRSDWLEVDYHNSLHRFLRRRAPSLQIERERPIDAVVEGTRRRLDLAIDGRVVIELKRHLRKTADADRAFGQIRGYAQAWPHGPVLLVLCETGDDFAQRRGLQNKIEELRAANYAVVAIAAGHRALA